VIVGAALLVLAGLGLFVGGVVTDVRALYWACVAVCVVAAVLLVRARRPAPEGEPTSPAPTAEEPAAPARPAAGEPGPAEPWPVPPVPADAAGVPAAPADRAGTHRAPGHEARQPTTDPGAALLAQPGAHAEPVEPRGPAPGTGEQPATAGATAVGRGSRSRRRGAHTTSADLPPARVDGQPTEPGVEEVEVTDLLLVVDLTDEVLVVDEHPRYHLDGCRWLTGRETVPLPLDEARTDGFTPCALCAPDRHLADRERGRRAR
jgi:hypothetical protein